jgi:hypothetical protein
MLNFAPNIWQIANPVKNCNLSLASACAQYPSLYILKKALLVGNVMEYARDGADGSMPLEVAID